MKEIQLTQGQVALVDDEDFEYLSQWKWFAYSHRYTWYAARQTRVYDELGSRQVAVFMHRAVMKNPDKCFLVDHIDKNGLNNQKNNLRLCSNSENRRNSKKQENNTSGYKGVTLDKRTGTYRVRIIVGNKRKSMGYYPDVITAAKIYDELAKEYYGEFASLNFPE